jgi:predicted short-subunit dehydrogenase-like oxidoreductase (DUF2520 family)
MKSIVLLGAGNVAAHLCKAIHNLLDFKVIQVYNRSEKSLTFFPSTLDKTSSLAEIKEADLYIIAVSDDAIVSFSESLLIKNKLVVHTSGSVPMKTLSGKNRKGVFYPLQSFSKNSEVDFSEIPMCIEAQNESDLGLLNQLGNSISNNVLAISSEKREKIHLSAVIVNNFVNYLYQVGNDLMQEQSLSFDLLKPLILETANKINTLSPAEAQTGPAKRNDKKTIEKQLHLLKDSPYKDIYQDITNSILKKYNNH